MKVCVNSANMSCPPPIAYCRPICFEADPSKCACSNPEFQQGVWQKPICSGAMIDTDDKAYHLAPPGAASCDTGSSPGEMECLASALDITMKASQTMSRKQLQKGAGGTCLDGAFGQVPGGCSVQSGGDWAAYYKEGVATLDGCVADMYQLICWGDKGETVLLADAHAGDSVLTVAEQAGFTFGDLLKIGDEHGLLAGFASIVLSKPLERDHRAGTIIKKQNAPFECKEGIKNWESGWSESKKDWCCNFQNTACEFDCLEGDEIWEESWSLEKKDWCCKHKAVACVSDHEHDHWHSQAEHEDTIPLDRDTEEVADENDNENDDKNDDENDDENETRKGDGRRRHYHDKRGHRDRDREEERLDHRRHGDHDHHQGGRRRARRRSTRSTTTPNPQSTIHPNLPNPESPDVSGELVHLTDSDDEAEHKGSDEDDSDEFAGLIATQHRDDDSDKEADYDYDEGKQSEHGGLYIVGAEDDTERKGKKHAHGGKGKGKGGLKASLSELDSSSEAVVVDEEQVHEAMQLAEWTIDTSAVDAAAVNAVNARLAQGVL